MIKALILLFVVIMAQAQTARFPGAVVTDSDLMVQTNNAQSTLAASMTSTDTTLTVVSAAKFRGNMLLSIGSEIVKTCSIAGNIVSLGYSSCPNVDGRGFDGTSASSHTSGSQVSAFADAWHHNALKVEVEAMGAALANKIPNWASITGNYDMVLFNLNNANKNVEWGANAMPQAAALTAIADAYGISPAPFQTVAIQGALRGGNTNSVGVLGNCTASAGIVKGCWGANFLANSQTIAGSSATNVGGMWGIEVDLNVDVAPAANPGFALGVSVVGAAMQTPPTRFVGFSVEKAAFEGHISVPWKIGFESDDGGSVIALRAGPLHLIEGATTVSGLGSKTPTKNTVWWVSDATAGSNPCAGSGSGAYAEGTGAAWTCATIGSTDFSQGIQLVGRAPGGGGVTGTIAQSGDGTFQLTTTAAYNLLINGVSAGVFTSTGLTVPAIKSTTGRRYVCADTNGLLISQAAACSGT